MEARPFMTATTHAQSTPLAQADVLACYAGALARLAVTRTRAARAAILDEMASLAGEAATAYQGGPQGENTLADPIAWHETASLLTQLAASQRGFYLDPDADLFDTDGFECLWKDVMHAATAAEFAAAFSGLAAEMTEDLDADDKQPENGKTADGAVQSPAGELPGAVTARRRIGLTRLREAAAAVTTAWETQGS
jgi:hypothetical protein